MASRAPSYETLVARNDGYIADDVQEKLRRCRFLIAGCGIGSSFAELVVRMGAEHITLADADTVGEINLNRQFFSAADIGAAKVAALAARLRAINPNAQVAAVNRYLDAGNVEALVGEADMVFDTIDFLSLGAIIALHDECRRRRKPIITALAVGWGGACLYFPPGGPVSLRQICGLPESGPVDDIPYPVAFGRVLHRLATRLDPEVVSVVAKALTVMEDGTPCPASQVAPGSFAVAALAGTLVHRILAGRPVQTAPQLVLADLPTVTASPGIDLLG